MKVISIYKNHDWLNFGEKYTLTLPAAERSLRHKKLVLDDGSYVYVDFDQVMEDSVQTLRISEDGNFTFVKFKGETPSFLEGKTQYTHAEIMAVLEDSNGVWFVTEVTSNSRFRRCQGCLR